MERRGLIAAAALAPSAFGATPRAQAQPAGAGRAASLDDALRPFLMRHGLPALAAAVVRGGEVIAAGAVGTRRAGADAPVTIDDRFHIGSDTKAMTSLLAGTLVEQGAIRWDSTVSDVFPELAAGMAVGITGGLRTVTLKQLLSHTGGIQGPGEAFSRVLAGSGAQGDLNLDELRYRMVREWCGQPLAADPGTTFGYSNMGYVIAGAMLERVAGRMWEELVVERIFDPLGLRTAGFGPQASLGRTDAPLGHVVRPDGTLRPMLAGPAADNPAVLGPAGTVHLSILDFAAWAAWNVGEGRSGPALVRPDTLRKLHARVVDIPEPNAVPGSVARSGYGLGWISARPAAGRGTMLMHEGSNTMNHALIVLEPARDLGVVLTTNVGRENTGAALEAVLVELYRRFGQG